MARCYCVHKRSLLISKYFLAVPEAPGQPEVTKISTNSIDITWVTPTSDGGSPITGYVIEKKNTSSSWTEVSTSTSSENLSTVTGLQEGVEYQFRVAAGNKAGQGSFSVASQPAICKAATSK